MRCIDADKLKESLKKLKAKANNKKYEQGLQDAIDGYFPQIIDDEPTIEATQVLDKLKEKIMNKYREVDNTSYYYHDRDTAQSALTDAYENVLSWINEMTGEGDDSE